MQIIHYCCGSYDGGNYGGVARYDYHIKLVFPNRKFFRGPTQKQQMIKYLDKCTEPIVITDNHLSIDIPNKYPCIIVHHGSALTHAKRDPTWGEPWKSLCCNGQKKMLSYRNPNNTLIISVSQFCSSEFLKFFPKKYPLFKNILVPHTSELDENRYKKNFNNNPTILGNWKDRNKGRDVVIKINQLGIFRFQQLKVYPKNGNIKQFNNKKQNIYCNADMFLQLSKSEAGPYAALDALLCGLVVISTNVGLFYKDVPETCFVKVQWKRMHDLAYVKSRILYGWKNRKTLAANARKWYLENCSFSWWKETMVKTVRDFHDHQYDKQEKPEEVSS